jgi:hypothetical protein
MLSKGARERFVGTVTCIKGHRQYVRGALYECFGSFGKPAGADVSRERTTCGSSKCPGKMKSGNSRGLRDRLQG